MGCSAPLESPHSSLLAHQSATQRFLQHAHTSGSARQPDTLRYFKQKAAAFVVPGWRDVRRELPFWVVISTYVGPTERLSCMYRKENVSCRSKVTEAVHAGKKVPFDEAERSLSSTRGL